MRGFALHWIAWRRRTAIEIRPLLVKAVDDLTAALADRPDDFEVLYRLAWCLVHVDAPSVEATLERAGRVAGTDFRFHDTLARWMLLRSNNADVAGQPEEGTRIREAILGQVLSVLPHDPANIALLIRAATVCLLLKQPDEGERFLARILQLVPGHPTAHSLLAQRRFEQGELEAALEHTDAALAVDRESPVLYRHRGLIHMRRGDRPAARRDFERVLELDAPLSIRREAEGFLERLR